MAFVLAGDAGAFTLAVLCDVCARTTDGRQGPDARTLVRGLLDEGWQVDLWGGTIRCPDCRPADAPMTITHRP